MAVAAIEPTVEMTVLAMAILDDEVEDIFWDFFAGRGVYNYASRNSGFLIYTASLIDEEKIKILKNCGAETAVLSKLVEK